MVGVWVHSEDGLRSVSCGLIWGMRVRSQEQRPKFWAVQVARCTCQQKWERLEGACLRGSSQAFILREVGAEVSVRQATHINNI